VLAYCSAIDKLNNERKHTMNTNRIAPRLLSLALAAVITGSMLAGIDALAQRGQAADSLLAQASHQAAKPL
jgi:hypothetical protein